MVKKVENWSKSQVVISKDRKFIVYTDGLHNGNTFSGKIVYYI